MFRKRPQDPLLDERTSTLCTSDFCFHFIPHFCSSCVLHKLTAVHRYGPSQADVAVFKALQSAPNTEKYPNAARWYKHIATYDSEFATLPGDASKAYSAYGPEEGELPINPAKTEEKADDDDVDLFGSDDEEEDAEAVRIREERLEAYRKKKENKPKVAAKSVVTLDVKPWGLYRLHPCLKHCLTSCR